MRDEATAVDIHGRNIADPLRSVRMRACCTVCAKLANWLQAGALRLRRRPRVCRHLAVYTLCVTRWASTTTCGDHAWLIAVVNNFVLNRHWTFDAGDGRVHFQAVALSS